MTVWHVMACLGLGPSSTFSMRLLLGPLQGALGKQKEIRDAGCHTEWRSVSDRTLEFWMVGSGGHSWQLN